MDHDRTVERPRVSALLIRAARRHVTLVHASRGFGKTTALLHAFGDHAVFVAVPAEADTLLEVLSALTEAIADIAPGAHLSFAIAYERASGATSPESELSRWFVEHVHALEVTFVIDDIERVARIPRVVDLLERVVADAPERLRWVLAGSTLEALPIASWLAHGVSDLPLGEDDLRLTPSEADAIAQSAGAGVDDAGLTALLNCSSGWAAGFTFGVRFLDDPAVRPALLAASDRNAAYDVALRARLSMLDAADRTQLIELARLPDLDPALLQAYGGERATGVLDSVSARFPEIIVPQRPWPVFDETLREKLLAEIPPAHDQERIARALEKAGRFTEALRGYIRFGAALAAAYLLEEHGLRLVEQGEIDLVDTAFLRFHLADTGASPTHLALQAILEAHRGRLDTSEAWYTLALERLEDPRLRLRILTSFALDLLRRGREDCIALMEATLDTGGGAAEGIALRATLATAYAHFNRPDDAVATVGEVLAALDESLPPHLLARIEHQISYVMLNTGQFARARLFAERAVRTAERAGAYDVAGRALTVLYQLAADVDDDPAGSLRHLDRTAAYGLRSGNPQMRLFALVGAYEIHIERGDPANAQAVLRAIFAAELAQYAEFTSVAILPSEAMTLGWKGDFMGAYQLLEGSAERQHGPERRSLRYAEIAFYAAAAGLDAEADEAFREADRQLGNAPENDKRTRRTRFFLTLTAQLRGHPVGPDLLGLLRFVVPEGDLRTSALVEVAEAIERWRGDRTQRRGVRVAMDSLYRQYLGGYARLIERLPTERFFKD